MTTTNASLRDWVADVAKLTRPDRIQWCDGSQAEHDGLVDLMLTRGDLIALNQATHPHCYLHRSDPTDVARVEHLTYVCTKSREDAGPNNNWMDPAEANARIDALFDGCMRGRTMYVVPYCMGPLGLALCALRSGDHRQRIRRAQHADHDADGRGGAAPHRARPQLRPWPALDGRPRPRTGD